MVNLAAYFIAGCVINGREVVLLTTMLFGLLQHFIRTGTFGFPRTCGEAGIGAAERIAFVLLISALRLSNSGHFCLHSYCAANPELNGARSKAAVENCERLAGNGGVSPRQRRGGRENVFNF